jgi:SPP1 gp7 family putative phage head morphogenesis protein
MRSKKKSVHQAVKEIRSNYSEFNQLYQRRKPIDVRGKKPFLDIEVGVDTSAIYKRMDLTPYMPDELLQKKKIEILNKMMLDDEIEGSVDDLITVRLSSGHEVEAASDSDRDKEIRDFVEFNLDNIEGSFDDDLREIAQAVPLGVSINEMVWYEIKKGRWAGKIGLRSIKSKNPRYFNIWTDDFDNVQDYGIVNISSLNYGQKYPADKFIIYSFRKRYENIWGTSKIRTLYDLYFIKQVVLRAYGIFIEKFGHPTMTFKTKGVVDDGTKTYLLNVIKQMRYETGLIVPPGVEATITDPSKVTADIHQSALTWINSQIRKKIMGETLTSDSSSAGGKGTQALGNVHQDQLHYIVEQLGIDISEKAVNAQLIQRLVDYNYEDVDDYPDFKFKPLIKEDTDKLIATYYEGVDKQVIKPIPEDEEKIREFLNFPPRKTEETPSQAVKQDKVDEGKPATPGQPIPAPTAQAVQATEPEDISQYAEKIFTGTTRRKLTKYEEGCVDYIELKGTHESLHDKYMIQAGKLVQDGIKNIIVQVQKGKIIENKNFEAIKSLTFSTTGDLKQVFHSLLVDAFEDGIKTAREEILKKKKKFHHKYSEMVKFQDNYDLRKIDYPEALQFFEAQSFNMAGVERDNILKKVKQVLMDSIKNGTSISDTVNDLQDELKEYYNTGEVADDALKSYRLENVVRTNLSTALNEGRNNFFQNPELDGYVTAYQYSAVMDDRTRDRHAKLDGLIFSVTNPVWATIGPPPQPDPWQCRCIRVPITQDEPWVESNVPAWVWAW